MDKEKLKAALRAALGKQKLILVSNRGPVKFTLNSKGQTIAKRGSGGLITALNSVLKATGAIWVAVAMTETDRQIAKKQQLIGFPQEDPVFWLYLVDIKPPIYDLYYNQISNRLLWFLHHYLFPTTQQPAFSTQDELAWQAYAYVNEKLAQTVAQLAANEQAPVVMVHDYHLYLLPGYLRSLKPEAVIFHFFHTPWCSPDYLRLLPRYMRQTILQALLANNLIGMHSWRYVRNFMHCCQEFLGYQVSEEKNVIFSPQKTRVKAYPISISIDDLNFFSQADQVLAYKKQLEAEKKGLKLIVRIDRAELSKNLIRGFAAYKLLLANHPELKGKVKMLVLTHPTRQNLLDYQQYLKEIKRQVQDINRSFGFPGWQPVRLSVKDNYWFSLAAMQLYDALLINPTFDGMNLVAKEAAALNRNNGVIVLSENAGAYEELRDAVLGINPFDISETADQLYQALVMPPLERKLRAERLKEIVTKNDVLKWLYYQISDLQTAVKVRS